VLLLSKTIRKIKLQDLLQEAVKQVLEKMRNVSLLSQTEPVTGFMIVLGNHKQNPDANEVKKIPLLLKLAFTLLFIVTIPSNIIHYSAINLLWFCDIAIIIAFFGIWFESSLLVSMAALGSVATQLAWQVDYFFHLASGNRLFGFSDYMFDPNLSAFNKAVSLFHVWMPYVLLYSLRIVRYNRWALIGQTMTGSIAILLSFLLTKDMFGPAGNLNKVYGLSDKEPQTWVAPWLWLIVVMAYCFLCIYLPMHFLFAWLFKKQRHNPAKN
jgi:hypothetical protein